MKVKRASWKITITEKTNRVAYWGAHYVNDLTYFLPMTVFLIIFILIFDSFAKPALVCILIFPFYILPVLYTFSYTFKQERRAIYIVAITILLIMTLGAGLLLARFAPPIENGGDSLYKFLKFIPTYSITMTITFNTRMLDLLEWYRERN